MTANDSFFEQRKAAAILKHGVLENYLEPFVAMTTKRAAVKRAWYIDAYAGPGVYGDEENEPGSPGSPSIALTTAESLAKLRNPRDLRCIFIECDPKYASRLSRLVRAFSPPSPAQVLVGTAEARLPEAFAGVGIDPVLIFLDPFCAAIPYALMESILSTRPDSVPNEVLLNFSIEGMSRLAARLASGAKLAQGDLAKRAELDAFLGDTDWLDLFRDYYEPNHEGSATEGVLAVAQSYRERVKRDTGYDAFAIPIRRDVGNLPIFELTLFFRHPAARCKFLDAASAGNSKWRRHLSEVRKTEDAARHDGALLGSDFSKSHFEKEWQRSEDRLDKLWEAALKANIEAMLTTRPEVRVNTAIVEIYGDHLGLAGEKHLRYAWNALFREGRTSRCPTSSLWKETITAVPPH
jgi:three-Cys-motif partner protein